MNLLDVSFKTSQVQPGLDWVVPVSPLSSLCPANTGLAVNTCLDTDSLALLSSCPALSTIQPDILQMVQSSVSNYRKILEYNTVKISENYTAFPDFRKNKYH